MPDTVAFAAIFRVGYNAEVGDFVSELFGDGHGLVTRAIVHHDHFDIPLRRTNVRGDTGKRSGQPKLFIVGRDDDGKFGRRGGHRTEGSFQPCAPTSGTKRHGSSTVVRNVSRRRSTSCNS